MKKVLLGILAGFILITIYFMSSNNRSVAFVSDTKTSPAYLKANEAILNGDYKKAIYIYQKILVNSPNDKQAMIGLARAQILILDFAMGAKTLLLYKSKFGEDNSFLIEKSRFFAFTDKPKLALAIIKKMLLDDPKNQTLLDIKGFALARLTPEINVDVNQLNETTPEIMAADLKLRQGDQLSAIETYYSLLNKNENNQEALIKLIRAQILNGDYRVTNNFAIYEKKFGKDDVYLEEKARWLTFTRQTKEALIIINQLLAKYPNARDLLDLKAAASNQVIVD